MTYWNTFQENRWRNSVTYNSVKLFYTFPCGFMSAITTKSNIIGNLASLGDFITPLTLSWRKPISYRNQSIYLLYKPMDWFLYDIGLRRERIKFISKSNICTWNFHIQYSPELTNFLQKQYCLFHLLLIYFRAVLQSCYCFITKYKKSNC